MTKGKHIHKEKMKRLTKGKNYSNILITWSLSTATDYHTSQNLPLGNETQRTILRCLSEFSDKRYLTPMDILLNYHFEKRYVT